MSEELEVRNQKLAANETRHVTQGGVAAQPTNPNQVIWCPKVSQWMTRKEHQEMFAPTVPF